MAQIKLPDMDPIEIDDGYVGWWAAVNANGDVYYHQKEPDDKAVSWKNQFSTGSLITIPHEYLRQHNWRTLKVCVTQQVKVGYYETPYTRAYVASLCGPSKRYPIVGSEFSFSDRKWKADQFHSSYFDGWTYMGETKPEGW